MDIKGLDAVVKSIEDISDTDKIRIAMGKCCALVERTAKQNAPKDTGALRNSIQSEVRETGEEIQGVVFTPLEYAPYVEYGTGLFAEENGRKTPWLYEDEETGETIFTRGQKPANYGGNPQGFLRPALFENKEKITKLLGESVKK